MYPPLYDKMKELLRQRWHYPLKNVTRREAMQETKKWFRLIDVLVKEWGLSHVLLTEKQKTRIEKVYAKFERDGVVR